MSVFTENINIAPLPKENKWTTTKPVRFYLYEEWVWDYVDIPAWFHFDWCSIPFCFLWPKTAPHTITSCCLHDYLYENHKYWFHFSNYLFYKALRINKVWIIQATIYLLWVTIFWWFSYYNLLDKMKLWNF